jgi:hypothetical protein
MRTYGWVWVLILLAARLAAGCIQKYSPKPDSSYTNALVVEGSLNSGQGQALLKISRTGSLSAPAQMPEDGATVVVQASDSTKYPLPEISVGNYAAQNLNLDSTRQYRLLISTVEGDSYVSDFVSIVPNPPVDSVNYLSEADGSVDVWVYTHNPQGNTRYYQWEYGETWEFHSAYASSLRYDTVSTPYGDSIYVIPTELQLATAPPVDSAIYRCWQFDSSTLLLIGNSVALSTDAISLPIANIPAGSQKLSYLYSINIQQFGWSEAGYQFLMAMKSNTETIGSYFSPQPIQLGSNIHCVNNPSKLVVGFFNISELQQMRYFISNSQLPNWNYNAGCSLQVIDNLSDSIAKYSLGLLPVQPVDSAPVPFNNYAFTILNFTASSAQCVDCTLSGTSIKPPFWP